MLPNVIIELGNGNLGRVASMSDGVAGLVLTGTAVPSDEPNGVSGLALNTPYLLSSPKDLTPLGVTAANNPLVYKEVVSFYAASGDGAELYLLAVTEATTLTAICAVTAASPIRTLIDYAGGRIRLLGVNKRPPAAYTPTLTQGIDGDAITAAAAAQSVAESYTGLIWPFRTFLPAPAWTGSIANLYQPRAASYNRCAFVLASDDATDHTAAIGQALGRAAKIAVNRSIARVRDGAIAPIGYLTDGSLPEAKAGMWDALNSAGYIFYRTFQGKEGYYWNDDHMAAPLSDDYSALNLGRVIDKAIIIAYTTYIDYVNDTIQVDAASGKIPLPLCKDYEAAITRAVNLQMGGEISGFNAYVNPEQNVISSSRMVIECSIVPTAILREIKVNLAFNNPFKTT